MAQDWDQADILALPLLDGGDGIGQVIEARPDHALILLTLRTGRGATLPVGRSEVVAILATGREALDAGLWPVLGFEQLPRTADWHDPRLRPEAIHDPAAVEAFLNACHGHYPWDGFPDRTFFDGLLLPGRPRPDAARRSR